jgi:trehalose-6-phosphate synthase
LFHYLPGEINFDEAYWEAYQEANMSFAQAISAIIKDGDLVWVQDYHLMLLPALLRDNVPLNYNVQIGFFLHTPFPSSEIYRYAAYRYCNHTYGHPQSLDYNL